MPFGEVQKLKKAVEGEGGGQGGRGGKQWRWAAKSRASSSVCSSESGSSGCRRAKLRFRDREDLTKPKYRNLPINSKGFLIVLERWFFRRISIQQRH